MQFKWPHKNKPRMVSTERQMKQKKNYEFTGRNLKVNRPPEGLGLVGYVTKTIASNKRLFYLLSIDTWEAKKAFLLPQKNTILEQDKIQCTNHWIWGQFTTCLINWWTKRGQRSRNTYTVCNSAWEIIQLNCQTNQHEGSATKELGGKSISFPAPTTTT